MENDSVPNGRRFSLVYLKNDQIKTDSPRMRHRLGYAIKNLKIDFRNILEAELGISISPNDAYHEEWSKILANFHLRDVLDSITIIYDELSTRVNRDRYSTVSRQRDSFIENVNRIFEEENIGHYVDEQGGVHYRVDEEFEHIRAAAISGLGASRYNNVRNSFENAYGALDSTPPDFRGAVKDMFDAVESLFKLIFPKPAVLGTKTSQEYIKPLLDQKYSGLIPAHRAALKQLSQFDSWIEFAHIYRHATGGEEPAPPAEEMALQFIASGSAWLRWLISLEPNNEVKSAPQTGHVTPDIQPPDGQQG